MNHSPSDTCVARRRSLTVVELSPGSSRWLFPRELAILVLCVATWCMSLQVVEGRAEQQSTRSPAAEEFEVASVRLNTLRRPPINSIDLNVLRAMPLNVQNGRFSLQGAPLALLVELAYGATPFQVVGGPSWVRTDRYDVEARTDASSTWVEMQPMLKSLLAERFKLVVKRETRALPLYELVRTDGATKLSVSKEGSCVVVGAGRSGDSPVVPGQFAPLNTCGGVRKQILPDGSQRLQKIEAIAIPIQRLIEVLGDELDRPIVDATGLNGTFDVHLEFSADLPAAVGLQNQPGSSALDQSAPSVFTAVQEQLGLRLDRRAVQLRYWS